MSERRYLSKQGLDKLVANIKAYIANKRSTVLRFATVEDYEAALEIPEGEEGYVSDNALVVIDECENTISAKSVRVESVFCAVYKMKNRPPSLFEVTLSDTQTAIDTEYFVPPEHDRSSEKTVAEFPAGEYYMLLVSEEEDRYIIAKLDGGNFYPVTVKGGAVTVSDTAASTQAEARGYELLGEPDGTDDYTLMIKKINYYTEE